MNAEELHDRLKVDADHDPTALAVLELHKPVAWHHWLTKAVLGHECQGEDVSGYEWEWPEYPCKTVAVIAMSYGVTIE